MKKMINNWCSTIHHRRMIAQTKRLLLHHIRNKSYLPYFNHPKSDHENVLEMIRFFKIGYEDGYFAHGDSFDVAQWMDANKDKVLEIYDGLVQKA